jgi:hypothetical protein
MSDPRHPKPSLACTLTSRYPVLHSSINHRHQQRLLNHDHVSWGQASATHCHLSVLLLLLVLISSVMVWTHLMILLLTIDYY